MTDGQTDGRTQGHGYYLGCIASRGKKYKYQLSLMNPRDGIVLTDLLTSAYYKKLCYRRVTARCVLSVVILPITTQQCRNYLYDKS